MKKTIVLLLLMIVGSASAVTTVGDGWKGPSGGGTSQDWFTAGNWQYGVPTIQSDYATSGKYGVTTYYGTSGTNYDNSLTTAPIIANGDARAVEIRVGGTAVTGTAETAYLIMNSGTLKTMNWLGLTINTGVGDRNGTFYMHGGTVTLGGATADGLDTGARTTGHLYVGNGTVSDSAVGKLYMDGGSIDVGANFIIGNGAHCRGEAYLSDDALITVGGNFQMRPNSLNPNAPKLDISGTAKIIITGDKTAAVQGYIDNGWIYSNGVAIDNYSIVSYDAGTGKTTIAVPEPATVCLLGLGALSLLRRKS